MDALIQNHDGMQQLPEALAALGEYKQFILWTTITRGGKQVKLPIDHRSAMVANAHDPEIWLDAETALKIAKERGPKYNVGFVFTKKDPFYFVDLDKCLNPDNETWSPVAQGVLDVLRGAAVEVSQSLRGLHIIGTCQGEVPDHACKNIPLGLELYTEGRFVALTGINVIGTVIKETSVGLRSLINSHFPPRGSSKDQDWTIAPAPGYTGPEDDDELIAKALASKSAGSAFSDKHVTFAALWDGDEDALSGAFADDNRAYDASSADMSLAQHLAFWTGNNCERINTIMLRSGLVRDKWDREDYLIRTITRAVSMQEAIYSIGGVVDDGLPPLKGASPKQREFGENLRSQKLTGLDDVAKAALCTGPASQARFWIENNDKSIEELKAIITPAKTVVSPLGNISGPELLEGYQFLSTTQQIEHFKGCVYVQDVHRVFTPSGASLRPEQFNATYGGYTFQLESNSSGKTTRKAWEAFTESQAVRYPKAESTCFRPELQPGEVITEAGCTLVNVYAPAQVERIPGDVKLFLSHVERLLPNENDREIFFSYLAACVQRPGVKFQWCILLQGCEGNGKTVFYQVLSHALGERFAHIPNAADITNAFNAWIEQKLIIGIEEIHTAGRQEVADTLKPWITNKRIEIHGKGQNQRTGDNRANFILFSNHKDAVLKTENDRRYCVFYTAQQEMADLARDGMDGAYFTRLYDYLEHGGYSHITDYLATRPITVDIMGRAPTTSSTGEAVRSSLGVAEQIIHEAIELDEPGFRGDLVCTRAAGELLRANGKRLSPQKIAGLLTNLGYAKHPALVGSDGKLSIDGIRRRIYTKCGSMTAHLKTPEAVADVWKRAQVVPVQDGGGVQAVSTFLDRPEPP